MKIKECCTVESQECIAKGIYSMWISTKVIAKEAKAGQFISLFSKDGSRLLPRPISLCEIDREGGRLRIVYRVAGAGTEEFSHLKAGDEVDQRRFARAVFSKEGVYLTFCDREIDVLIGVKVAEPFADVLHAKQLFQSSHSPFR